MSEPYRVEHVVSLMRHAAMSTTYKPALLKALVRVARAESGLVVPLSVLGREFARMYWNQTVIYHLRQAAVISKESEVVKLVRRTAAEYKSRTYADLPVSGRIKIENAMSRVLTLDVVRRFHASKPASMPMLYAWNSGDSSLILTESSLQFLRAHGPTLEIVANYHWAEFLEACNRLAPRIIQKVSRDGALRGALTKYLRILMEDDSAGCFYCRRSFGVDRSPVVDHVIPWSFLLEDPIWDLVAACGQCNGMKSDWLPERSYLERLVERNVRLAKAPLNGRASALISPEDTYRLYDAAISLEWPAFWSPIDAQIR